MNDICCIGHLTLDKVITSKATAFMPGGTAFYFSRAIRNLNVDYLLITALADTELKTVTDLRALGIDVTIYPSRHTVYFENKYAGDQNHRTQRVLHEADPFSVGQLSDASARIFHLGPLLADDIPGEVIKMLAAKATVSLDAQGYLRRVAQEQVVAIDWLQKKELLPYISILKANEHELEVLTGQKDIRAGALMLSAMGVKEVVITLGDMGSVIYTEGVFYDIPAYKPAAIVDATGCGDTYMAGYLAKRVKGISCQQAGQFASAMASLKIEASGPFGGTEEDVMAVYERAV